MLFRVIVGVVLIFKVFANVRPFQGIENLQAFTLLLLVRHTLEPGVLQNLPDA